MLAKERQNKILDILYEKKIIKISEIVRLFSVSNETARRDLESIQDLGVAKRVYGGAVLTVEDNSKNKDDPTGHTRQVAKTKRARRKRRHWQKSRGIYS